MEVTKNEGGVSVTLAVGESALVVDAEGNPVRVYIGHGADETAPTSVGANLIGGASVAVKLCPNMLLVLAGAAT